jgi:hypothetical protein
MNRSSLVSLATFAILSVLSGCGDRPVFGLGRADAGRDASFDAHAGDTAALLDTGVDALDDASLDASPDVGTSDVGTFDVGMIDAALPDARVPDVGTRDGGPLPDVRLPDVGLADGDGGHLGPAPVDLGSPGDLASPGAYVLIGETGITNVIGSMISGGHLGVSPASSTAITGFALILDPSGQFSTSASVVPPARVHAADYAVPTPSNLTSAIAGMRSAYTDAATRPGPDFLDLLSGNIGGQVLVPGLYNWGSSVNIGADLTFVGGPNDVWILQVTNDVDLSAAVSMTLAGGANAENIFWQVAGTVVMGSGSHFEGIILCSTGITMQTNASLHGRALAQSLVALDDNAITAP